jgi:nucleotide-binding universal stress UspA family protein
MKAKREHVKDKMMVIKLFSINYAKDLIINYAKDNSMDLIIMGNRGNTGIEMFMLGSVANGVTTYAPCPVFLVR